MVNLITRRSSPERSSSTLLRFPSLVAFMALLLAGQAGAAILYSDDGLEIRWDNMLRYTAGIRLTAPDNHLSMSQHGDDGDRNFSRGLMMDRLDLLSTLDVSKEGFGFQASVEAWYDTVYHQRTARGRDFPAAARDLEGQYADLADTFAYGNFSIDDAPVTMRVGRQTLLWGESVFFDENSIAAAQAPADYVRSLIAPNAYSDDVYLPVDQLSIVVQPVPDISIAAYYQIGWRPSRLAAVGSYFSTSDVLGNGARILYPDHGGYLIHGRDQAPNGDRFGVSVRMNFDELNLGLYALQYASTYPALQLSPGKMPAGSDDLGQFNSEYPAGIALFGASFATYFADSSIAGEIAFRENAPVAGYPIASAYRYFISNDVPFYTYAKADTLRAEISSATTFSPSAVWDSADVTFELATNSILDVTENESALDLSKDRLAVNLRALFEPRYFQVLPGVDISLPVGFGYEPTGRYGPSYSENSHTGDLEAGISAIYASEWKARLTFTYFYGEPLRQPMADRNFIAFSVERTF